ncbi:MAG: hypothetical protein QOE29_1034 [Gaiellaceae bacterium]|nr:hypothetical protein [Gaiellaceae bacterium]
MMHSTNLMTQATQVGLKRAASPSLVDVAYDAILEGIFERGLPPGSRITIDALAKQLEMSITPIREALARLAAQRLVVWEENRGFTVAPLLSKQRYHDLYEAREFLELACVRSAVVTPRELDRLAEILERMTSAGRGPSYSEYVEFARLDDEFHVALVRMSSNEFLAQAFASLNFHLHQTRIYAGQGVSDFSEASSEHRQILEAFRGGSLAEVVRVDKAHLRRAQRRGWEILRSGAQ